MDNGTWGKSSWHLGLRSGPGPLRYRRVSLRWHRGPPRKVSWDSEPHEGGKLHTSDEGVVERTPVLPSRYCCQWCNGRWPLLFPRCGVVFGSGVVKSSEHVGLTWGNGSRREACYDAGVVVKTRLSI